MFKSCRGENSIIVKENLVSYFPLRAYDNVNDLAEIIMNPANCRSTKVKHFVKENINFAYPESVYVYNDIIEPNLVGDSYFGLLTSLNFPSAKGYLRFDYPLYKPV